MTWRALKPACFVAALSLWASTAAASCMEISPARAYEYATLVFTGVVLSATPAKDTFIFVLPEGGYTSRREPSIGTFLVTSVWKGALGDTITIAAYGGQFQPGEHHLIYATCSFRGFVHEYSKAFPLPRVDRCDRSSLVEYALWDRYWLPAPVSFRPGPKVSRVTLDDLLLALDSSDFRARYAASRALGEIADVRPLILARLRSVARGEAPGDPILAMRTIASMREAGRPAESDLAWVLRNASGEARAAALDALRTVAPRDSVSTYVVASLRDTSRDVLAKACESLAAICSSGASLGDSAWVEETVIGLARHPSSRVRAEAVRALGECRAAGMSVLGMIDHLRKYDPDSGVRGSARVAWRRLTGLDPWEGLPRGSPGAKESHRHR